MGFLDDARKKLTEAVDKHGSKIDAGIDKAAELADQRTGGKYRGKIHGGAAKAKDALDKLDGRSDADPRGGDGDPTRRPEQPERPRDRGTPPPPPPPQRGASDGPPVPPPPPPAPGTPPTPPAP